MNILQQIKNKVRSRSIHVAYVDVGSCNGCDIEVLACLAPRYDIEQYGIFVHNNPREADILLVIGAYTPGWEEKLAMAWDKMPAPKAAITIGNCPIYRVPLRPAWLLCRSAGKKAHPDCGRSPGLPAPPHRDPAGHHVSTRLGLCQLGGGASMKRIVDVNIPLGPIHPCFKEPVRLKCEAKGERIIGAEVELGYMKKGIERIMKGRPWQEVMFLAERVCGICSVIHNMVFIEAMEQMSDIALPPRAAYLRVIANELDRMQSHLLANFSYCYTIEHETLGMYLLDLREQVMDELERLTGARVTCAYIIPGGVRCDIPKKEAEALLVSLDRMESDLRRYTGMFENWPDDCPAEPGCRDSHAGGSRAGPCGWPDCPGERDCVDCRQNHPTYRKLGFVPITRPDCDNFARVMVRFDEVFQSIALIRKCLQELPKGLIRGGGVCKAGEIRYSGEAPRGELTYFIKSDEFGRIVEIQIQTPSIMNIEACCHEMIIGSDSIADVTSTFISADPCVACTER